MKVSVIPSTEAIPDVSDTEENMKNSPTCRKVQQKAKMETRSMSDRSIEFFLFLIARC